MQEPEMEPVPENKPVSQESQDTITEPFQRPTTKEQRHGNSSDTRVFRSLCGHATYEKKKIEERKDDADFFLLVSLPNYVK